MNDFTVSGSVFRSAGTAYVVGASAAFPHVIPTGAMAATYIAPAAHAAWAVDVIEPQRKRRTAAATATSVDRGFL